MRDLRVVDIARAVGTSPATFYQYFRDVEEAVLALAEEVGEDLAPVGELLGATGRGADGPRRARASSSTRSSTYWDAHRAVLRTRNLAAQEGDQRFRAVRNESLRPLREGLAAKVAEAQRPGASTPRSRPSPPRRARRDDGAHGRVPRRPRAARASSAASSSRRRRGSSTRR